MLMFLLNDVPCTCQLLSLLLVLLLFLTIIYWTFKAIREFWGLYSKKKKKTYLAPCLTSLKGSRDKGTDSERSSEDLNLEYTLRVLDSNIQYLAWQMKRIAGSTACSSASSTSVDTVVSLRSWAQSPAGSRSQTPPSPVPPSPSDDGQSWQQQQQHLIRPSGAGFQQVRQEIQSHCKVDFNLRQKLLKEQWGGPTPHSESLTQMIPFNPLLHPASRRTNSYMQISTSRITFLSYKEQELLNWHIQRKHRQKEAGFLHLAPVITRASASNARSEAGGVVHWMTQRPSVSQRSHSYTPPQSGRRGRRTPSKFPRSQSPRPCVRPPGPPPEDLLPPSMLIRKGGSQSTVRESEEIKLSSETHKEELVEVLTVFGQSKSPIFRISRSPGTPKEKEVSHRISKPISPKEGLGRASTFRESGRPKSPKEIETDSNRISRPVSPKEGLDRASTFREIRRPRSPKEKDEGSHRISRPVSPKEGLGRASTFRETGRPRSPKEKDSHGIGWRPVSPKEGLGRASTFKESGRPKSPKEIEKDSHGISRPVSPKEGLGKMGRVGSCEDKQAEVKVSTMTDRTFHTLSWSNMPELPRPCETQEKRVAAQPNFLDPSFMCQNHLELPCIATSQKEEDQKSLLFVGSPQRPSAITPAPQCLAHTILQSLDKEQATQDLKMQLAKGLETRHNQPSVEYPLCLLCGRCTPYCPHPPTPYNPHLLVYPRVIMQDGEACMTLGFLLSIKRSKFNAWGLMQRTDVPKTRHGKERPSKQEASRRTTPRRKSHDHAAGSRPPETETLVDSGGLKTRSRVSPPQALPVIATTPMLATPKSPKMQSRTPPARPTPPARRPGSPKTPEKPPSILKQLLSSLKHTFSRRRKETEKSAERSPKRLCPEKSSPSKKPPGVPRSVPVSPKPPKESGILSAKSPISEAQTKRAISNTMRASPLLTRKQEASTFRLATPQTSPASQQEDSTFRVTDLQTPTPSEQEASTLRFTTPRMPKSRKQEASTLKFTTPRTPPSRKKEASTFKSTTPWTRPEMGTPMTTSTKYESPRNYKSGHVQFEKPDSTWVSKKGDRSHKKSASPQTLKQSSMLHLGTPLWHSTPKSTRRPD